MSEQRSGTGNVVKSDDNFTLPWASENSVDPGHQVRRALMRVVIKKRVGWCSMLDEWMYLCSIDRGCPRRGAVPTAAGGGANYDPFVLGNLGGVDGTRDFPFCPSKADGNSLQTDGVHDQFYPLYILRKCRPRQQKPCLQGKDASTVGSLMHCFTFLHIPHCQQKITVNEIVIEGVVCLAPWSIFLLWPPSP